jgi:hypothetical protein
MAVAEPLTPSIAAALNFAADRSDGGIWSNLTPEIITQKLEPGGVEIRDARKLVDAPSLEREGFTIARLDIGPGQFDDSEWVDQVYTPACLELVRQLTGAKHVANFYPGVLIRDTGNPKAAPAAEFVHLDQTRESALPFFERAVDERARGQFSRMQIYNVWRTLTPPPQDVPLALCDQRTLDERDWVVGRTVEPSFPDGVPYVSSVFNAAQQWYYFSDVRTDEVIVFKGYDSDRAAPFGCLHGAFKDPAAARSAPLPRASAEMRVFALFD